MINDFSKLFQIFNSNLPPLEIIYVLADLKPCCRVLLNPAKIFELNKFCQNNNLHLELSSFKIKKMLDKGKGGFSNKIKKKSITDEDGLFYAYISKDKNRGEEAKYFEFARNDSYHGKIMGYPECCIQFYKRNKRNAFKKQGDFMLFCSHELKKYPFYNNYALRYFGISLISHFPCSLDCKKSQNIAKKNLYFLKKNLPEIAKLFEKELKSCVIYTENNGVFYFSDYEFDMQNIRFNSLKSTIKNKIYYMLEKYKKFKILSSNKIIINNLILEGDDIRIFLFE